MLVWALTAAQDQPRPTVRQAGPWFSSRPHPSKDMPGTSQGELVETQNKISELDPPPQLGPAGLDPHQLAGLNMEEQRFYPGSTWDLLFKSLF